MINAANLAGALGRPYHGYHRRIHEKAAALMHGVAKSHGFVDGNKRTSLLVTMLLIERSGYSLSLNDDTEIADVIVAVVEDAMSEADLVAWFRLRLVRA